MLPKLQHLRGFQGWDASEPWNGTVTVKFGAQDDAVGASFILGSMTTRTESGNHVWRTQGRADLDPTPGHCPGVYGTICLFVCCLL